MADVTLQVISDLTLHFMCCYVPCCKLALAHGSNELSITSVNCDELCCPVLHCRSILRYRVDNRHYNYNGVLQLCLAYATTIMSG